MNLNNKNNKEQRKLFVFIADLFNIILLIALWAFFWLKDYGDHIARPFGYKGNWLVFALYGVILVLITHMYGGYRVGHHRGWDLFFSGVLSLLIANVLGYLQTTLLAAKFLPVGPMVQATVIGWGYILLWTYVCQTIYKRIYPPYQMLVIFDGREYARDLIGKSLPVGINMW